MTVNTETSSIRYTGILDGVPLAVPFPVQAATEIAVFYGNNIQAVSNVDYVVAVNPPDYLTASVTPIVGFAALSGGIISINRIIPYLQSTDIPSLQTLATARVEQLFDRSVFMAQQLRDRMDKTLAFPNADPASSIGLLPAKADRIGKVLGFDAAGLPAAVSVSTTGAAAFSAYGLAWAMTASALTAMTSLGFSNFTRDNLRTPANSGDYLTALGFSNFVENLRAMASDADFRAAIGVYSTQTMDQRFPVNFLSGLQMSTAGGSDTINTTAGSAADSTNNIVLQLVAWAKTTAAWSVGNATGGLDIGAIAANTWYHWYVIGKPALGNDLIFSLNAAAPTLPAGYTYARYIGSALTDGASQWIKFYQYGDLFEWDVPVTSYNTANPGTAEVLAPLATPLGRKVRAWITGYLNNGTTDNVVVNFSDPAVANAAPATVGPRISLIGAATAATQAVSGDFYVTTDASKRIRLRLSASGANDRVAVNVKGYLNRRGQDGP